VMTMVLFFATPTFGCSTIDLGDNLFEVLMNANFLFEYPFCNVIWIISSEEILLNMKFHNINDLYLICIVPLYFFIVLIVTGFLIIYYLLCRH